MRWKDEQSSQQSNLVIHFRQYSQCGKGIRFLRSYENKHEQYKLYASVTAAYRPSTLQRKHGKICDKQYRIASQRYKMHSPSVFGAVPPLRRHPSTCDSRWRRSTSGTRRGRPIESRRGARDCVARPRAGRATGTTQIEISSERTSRNTLPARI